MVQQAVSQVQQAQALNIASVAPISDINLAYGAPLSSANLPTSIVATLSDASTQAINITWDNGTPEFNPNTAGTYVFSGSLILSGNITNVGGIKATVNVIVAPQPAPPPPPETPVNAASDLIQNAASSLINGMGDFLKWLFVTPAKTISSLPPAKTVTADLLKSAKDFQAGLIEPIMTLLKR